MGPKLGICFHRFQPAADIVAEARAAEEAGYDELWVIEDCFFTSGPTLAAAALTATERLAVGIGVLPVRARNPALTAMELATLAALGEGRLMGGLGHGVKEWMHQIGVWPASPLGALEETLCTVRALLAGERLSVDGHYVTLRNVALDMVPAVPPPLYLGVRNERSLRLSGRHADGTILAELCGPEYLSWARRLVTDGGGSPDHRFTVYCSAAVSSDGDQARQTMVPFVAQVLATAAMSVQLLPFYTELAARAASSSWEAAVAAMPVEWWQRLGPIGTPDDAAAYISTMREAGADAFALFPDPAAPIDDLRKLAKTVRPLLD